MQGISVCEYKRQLMRLRWRCNDVSLSNITYNHHPRVFHSAMTLTARRDNRAIVHLSGIADRSRRHQCR
jgi:hypothetical protein